MEGHNVNEQFEFQFCNLLRLRKPMKNHCQDIWYPHWILTVLFLPGCW